MSPRLNKSVTLIELLIAIILLSVIVIGFTSIDMFSRYHVLTADRRAKVQNEVSYILEHMSKEISKAIGNEGVNGVDSVVNNNTDNRITICIDENQDGRRNTNDCTGGDRMIAYRFYPATDYQVRYCPQCNNFTCGTCTPGWGTADNTLSRNITVCTFTKLEASNILADNYVEVSITACWNPAQAASSDNPEVTMSTRIKMPSVSTN